MSYPDPRDLGDQGELSAKFRPAHQEPEVTIGSDTAMRYLATGVSTNGQFGLYRVDMRPHASGPGPHFRRTMSERMDFCRRHDDYFL